jgi:hypothetical protein
MGLKINSTDVSTVIEALEFTDELKRRKFSEMREKYHNDKKVLQGLFGIVIVE